MKRINFGIGALLGAALLTAGCSGYRDECEDSRNPAECRVWRDSGGSVQDYLLGGMAGYVLASAMQNGQRVQYIQRDPGYRGPPRSLRSQFAPREVQLRRGYQRKLENQRREINRLRTQRDAARAQATKPKKSLFGGSRSSSGSTRRSSFSSRRR